LKMVDVHFLRGGGGLEKCASCTLWKMVDNYGWSLIKDVTNISLDLLLILSVFKMYFCRIVEQSEMQSTLSWANSIRSSKSNGKVNEFKCNFFVICRYLNFVKNQRIVLFYSIKKLNRLWEKGMLFSLNNE
jgi:hypothetical protein